MLENAHDYDAAAVTEYLIRTTVDYWTAFSFPAIFFARYL